MSAAPSVLKSIAAIRKAMTSPGKESDRSFELYSTITSLFRQSETITGGIESIEAVLALAPEIEAFRGKGSQMAAREFSRAIGYLVYLVKERLPPSELTPDRFPKEHEVPPSARDAVDCLEKLATHAFQRVQGPPVRSRHAAELRAVAWSVLDLVTEILRRPEHLAHALKVAADTRASAEERTAAVEFLVSYWDGDDPDEATVSLLEKLKADPPDRDFLVTVLQVQVELGLKDEFGAMFAVDDWDDALDEEE